MENFGQLLRRHRLAAVLTQESLAEHAGISATGIAACEAGWRGCHGRRPLHSCSTLSTSPETKLPYPALKGRQSSHRTDPSTMLPESSRTFKTVHSPMPTKQAISARRTSGFWLRHTSTCP